MIGIQDSSIDVDYAGRWSSNESQGFVFPNRGRRRVKSGFSLTNTDTFSTSRNTKKEIWFLPPNLFITQC